MKMVIMASLQRFLALMIQIVMKMMPSVKKHLRAFHPIVVYSHHIWYQGGTQIILKFDKQSEMPRPIPWNQTSDVHWGSTLIT